MKDKPSHNVLVGFYYPSLGRTMELSCTKCQMGCALRWVTGKTLSAYYVLNQFFNRFVSIFVKRHVSSKIIIAMIMILIMIKLIITFKRLWSLRNSGS